MKKQFLQLLLATALTPAVAAAADFTYMRPCVRANAAGSAFSTVEGDPCAIFYNPANLTTLSDLEVRLETARRLSPSAPLGESSLVYIRPVPDVQNKAAGFGYYAVRRKAASLDSFTFGVGKRKTIKYLQKPVFYGGSFKLVSLREEKSHLALGVDGGVKLEGSGGLRTALVFSDLLMGAGRSMLTITLGNSYRIKNTELLADLRARGSYSELFLGAEHTAFNGLLQLRAGKGLTLEGGQYLSLGAGVNLSPWSIDFAWSLPWAGYQKSYGYYGFNAGYRFGAPTFSEKLVGNAAKEAGDLRNQIENLRMQRADIESSIATYRVNKSVLETDLTMLQGRMRELEDNVKELEVQATDALYRKENPPPKKAYVPPPPPKWPRLHKVAAGETLRSIASKYYGNPNLWERVYKANEKHVSKGLPVEDSVFTIPAPPRDGE
ncbi:MAG: hypothetical protein M0011_09335 [Elusimicrobia bacterium]|nr:hypothetical protein [Elusimicrobiota bacterium]